MLKHFSLISLLITLFIFVSQVPLVKAQTQLSAPNTLDWITKGTAISAGDDGQWDRYLWGGFSNNVVKKGNSYFLYYQGSPTYDDACESVAGRAIGVATSTDGINWTKYSGNPVVEWQQSGSVEEGAASSGVWVGLDGKIYLYYGANTGTGCNVNAAGRLAISSDGFNFTDTGQVISPTNTSLWGYGDEIFPIGAFEYNSKWNVYYTPNGVAESRKLGVIKGDSPNALTISSAVNSGTIPAWGSVSVVLNGSSAYAFVNDPATNLPINVYSFNPIIPNNFTYLKSYTFADCNRGSVLYDTERSMWLMLCRQSPAATNYVIKTVGPLNPILLGDINEDRVVNILDYTLLSNAFGTSNFASDLNQDGIVNILDYVILSNNFGRTG